MTNHTENKSQKVFNIGTYLKNISYPYFIIQLNEPERMQEEVEKAIKKYLDVV